VGYRISGKNLNVRVLVKQIAMLLCAALMVAGLARANGFVSNVTVLSTAIDRASGNVVFIRLSSPPTGLPACSNNSFWHFTLSLDGVAGKEIYASLLAAIASGKPVEAVKSQP
jgi:hypothetical protein